MDGVPSEQGMDGLSHSTSGLFDEHDELAEPDMNINMGLLILTFMGVNQENTSSIQKYELVKYLSFLSHNNLRWRFSICLRNGWGT